MKKLSRPVLWPVLFLALAVMVFAHPAFADPSLTGSWTGTLQTPDGNSFDLTYTLKQDGAKITGSVQGPQGDPLDLLNGKIDGAKVYWEVNFNGATLAENGTVSVDATQIKLSIKSSDSAFPPMDITLSRAGATPAAAAATPTAATPAPAATTAGAGDASGTWSGQMQGPNGDMTLTFHFKQNGAALTGTVDNPMGGEPMAIENGKIDGDKVHWETSFNGMTITHDGTISGDAMKISIQSSDGSFPAMDVTLTRNGS